MLVLRRKRGESIVITTPEGREIRVDLLGLQNHRAIVGIVADPEVKVLRQELVGTAPNGGSRAS